MLGIENWCPLFIDFYFLIHMRVFQDFKISDAFCTFALYDIVMFLVSRGQISVQLYIPYERTFSLVF